MTTPSGQAGDKVPSGTAVPSASASKVETPTHASTQPVALQSASRPAGGIMMCNFDPATFTMVSIHTAKCALCDRRNMDTMRRCVGCTWQVCQPCFSKREGGELKHGNQDLALDGLYSTPVKRRVLFGGINPTPATNSGSPAHTTASASDLRKRPLPASNETEPPDLATAAPRTPVSEKRTRNAKGKGKKPVVDIYESESEMSEYSDDLPATPSPVKKRQKVSVQSKSRSVPIKPRRVSQGASGMPAASTRSHGHRNAFTAGGVHSSSAASAGAVGSSNTALTSSPDGHNVSILDREAGEGTIQSLLEQQGVDLPSNRYKEHLLGRRQPVMQDPVINVPRIVARSFAPRPSVEQIQQNIQRVAFGSGNIDVLSAAAAAAAAAEESGTSKIVDAQAQSIRDFVRGVARSLLRSIEYTERQHKSLLDQLQATVTGMMGKFTCEMPVAMQRMMTLDLDKDVDFLREDQKNEIKKTMSEVVKHFLETSTETRAATEAAATLDHVTPESDGPFSPPAIGYFRATPPRPSSRWGAEFTSSPSFRHSGNIFCTMSQQSVTGGASSGNAGQSQAAGRVPASSNGAQVASLMPSALPPFTP